MRDEERPVERKKSGEKRSQEPQKGIWATVKDNAALVTAIGALLGVLVTGAVNTYIANKDQLAQRQLETDNAQRQRELEQEKAQNAALQTYLDQMGQMLLNEGLANTAGDSDLRILARARTLAMFEQASPEGKRIALVFLNEAALIDNDDPVINLHGANMSDAELSGADLSGTSLGFANLRGANLSEANLNDAALSAADLREADLSRTSLIDAALCGTALGAANLSEADLSHAVLLDAYLVDASLKDAYLRDAALGAADMSGANLSGTYLGDAALSGAVMTDAELSRANLSGASLRDAVPGWLRLEADLGDYPCEPLTNEAVRNSVLRAETKFITIEELDQQASSLKGATMPNGQKYEDWLEDKEGHKEDGESSAP